MSSTQSPDASPQILLNRAQRRQLRRYIARKARSHVRKVNPYAALPVPGREAPMSNNNEHTSGGPEIVILPRTLAQPHIARKSTIDTEYLVTLHSKDIGALIEQIMELSKRVAALEGRSDEAEEPPVVPGD